MHLCAARLVNSDVLMLDKPTGLVDVKTADGGELVGVLPWNIIVLPCLSIIGQHARSHHHLSA